MRPAQTIGVVGGLACAFIIGAWTGPHLVSGGSTVATDEGADAATPAAAERTQPAVEAEIASLLASVPVTSEDLQARLKPLLNAGARMDAVSEGFGDAVEFAAVVHAAHNTGIPFVLLKHRVLEEDQNLTEAIRESRPDIHAGLEASRAQAEARSVVASVAG